MIRGTQLYPVKNTALIKTKDKWKNKKIGKDIPRLCACSETQLWPTFATPWIVAHQVFLSMGFPRKEYWSELPFPTAGDLPDSGIEPASLSYTALAGGFFTTMPHGKPHNVSGILPFS